MTPVEFHFVLPTGAPLANSSVEIQLAQSSINDDLDGVTMPRPVTLTTDGQGKATVPLWPSSTLYYVSVQDKASEAGLFYKFLVPELAPGQTVRLQDIVVDGAPSAVVWEDATLLLILNAKANSRTSELAAAVSAASAAAALVTINQHDDVIQSAVEASALSAFNANVLATAAAASQAAAAASQSAASTAATAATTKAAEAAASATGATASALAASASAAAAAASEEAIALVPKGRYRGTMNSEAEMFAVTNPQLGDKVKRVDLTDQVFELIALPINDIDNWLAYGIGQFNDDEYAADYATNYA